MFFVGIECTFRRTCSRQIDYLSLQYSRKRAPIYTNDRRSRFKLMIRVVQTIYFFFLFFASIRWKLDAWEVSYETTGPRCSICFHLELLLRLDISVKSCLRQSYLLLPVFFFFDCQQSASFHSKPCSQPKRFIFRE